MLTCALSVHSEFQLTLKKTVQGIKADETRLFVSTGIAVNSVVFRRLIFCQFAFIDQLQKKIFITISITSTLQIVIIVILVAVLFEHLNCFLGKEAC